MNQTTQNMSVISKHIISLEEKLTILEIASGRNEVTVQSLVDFKNKAYENIEGVKKDLAHTKETKLSMEEFSHEASILHNNINNMKTDVYLAKSFADSCSNYLEKYQPVYL